MLKTALEKTFTSKKYWLIFVLSMIFIFTLLVMVPVWTTPGNDFWFQIKLLKWYGVLLVIFLSISNGLLITMQTVIREETKLARNLKHKAVETTTALSLIFGALASTIACTACYSSILAMFGLGATAFLANNRLWISLATVLITIYAIYYSVKRLNHKCEACEISIDD